jgi:hypothetical protein
MYSLFISAVAGVLRGSILAEKAIRHRGRRGRGGSSLVARL